ncbi:YeeE/YedE family protein [Rhodobacteraceae bacterium M385]|nr:YeeE/YedE family protein [Rhodobacteraceae bacterium M385]
MRLIIAYAIGIIFGVGISISGMANPAKVLNFFDVAGTWDPSLIFVMGGALVTTFIGYKLVFGRSAPLFGSAFLLPERRDIDLPLVGGSAVFGIGWGIAGFCPGGALPALGTGRWEVFAFTGALGLGIIVARRVQIAMAAKA